MARKTQNAVLNSDGTFFQLTNDANSFVQFLQLFNALRFKQGTDKDGNLLWEDSEGKPTIVNTGEPYIPAKPRSGYGSYGTKVGFADPISPEKLDPQGVGKYLAKILEVSQMLILAGGDGFKDLKGLPVIKDLNILRNAIRDHFRKYSQDHAASLMPLNPKIDNRWQNTFKP
jgi:hypothetical protein